MEAPIKRGPGRPRIHPLQEDAPMTDTPEKSAFERIEMRPAQRAETSREAAERRSKEIMEHLADVDIMSVDEFAAPPPPDGWTHEWKRHTLLNQEDPAYQVQLRQMGWEPVPARMYPEMMPIGWTGEHIERKGMMLMRRPEMVTRRMRQMDSQRAANQVRAKEEQLTGAPAGQFERHKPDGTPLASVKKSYGPIAVPE